MIYKPNFIKKSFFLALCMTLLYGCDSSLPKPSEDFLISDIKDNINNKYRSYGGDEFSEFFTLDKVEIIDQRVKDDGVSIIAKITATCKGNFYKGYLEDLMGGREGCSGPGQVRSNEITLNYVKFDSGWRYQGNLFK